MKIIAANFITDINATIIRTDYISVVGLWSGPPVLRCGHALKSTLEFCHYPIRMSVKQSLENELSSKVQTHLNSIKFRNTQISVSLFSCFPHLRTSKKKKFERPV